MEGARVLYYHPVVLRLNFQFYQVFFCCTETINHKSSNILNFKPMHMNHLCKIKNSINNLHNCAISTVSHFIKQTLDEDNSFVLKEELCNHTGLLLYSWFEPLEKLITDIAHAETRWPVLQGLSQDERTLSCSWQHCIFCKQDSKQEFLWQNRILNRLPTQTVIFKCNESVSFLKRFVFERQ